MKQENQSLPGKFPPRRILTRESRLERAAWAFTDQRPIDPNDPHDTRDEYLSLQEHASLLEAGRERAEEWERLANEWREDYDKLKNKYEPMVIVTSATPGGEEKEEGENEGA